MDQITFLIDSLKESWMQLSAFLPRLLGAFVLLIGGWIVAKFLRKLTIRVLRLLRIDALAEKSGIEDFLVQGGVSFTAVTLLANLLYWFVMFTVILAVLLSLGLPAAAELFNKIILYIPNVIVSVLVLMFGSLFARFARGAISAYLNNVGVQGAEIVSTIAYWAILVFVVSLSLEQLSIGGQILISAFQLAFGALCLALALAFGLGGKGWAERILQRTLKDI